MRNLKITTSTQEIKNQIHELGLDPTKFNIPKKGSIVSVENSQKYLNRTSIISQWERGQSFRFWRPKYWAIRINSTGKLSIGQSY